MFGDEDLKAEEGRVVGHIAPEGAIEGDEATEDTPAPQIVGPAGTEGPSAPAELWRWSPEACRAFVAAAVDPLNAQKLVVRRGLDAAFATDAGAIFAAQMAGLIHTLTTHPVLSTRVLKLRAGEDGFVHLAIDRDLIEFVLYNSLPQVVDIATPGEGA